MGARLDDATDAVLGLHRLLTEDTPLDVVRQLAVARVGELLGGAAGLWLDEDDDLSMVAFSHPEPQLQAEMLALTGGLVHGPHSFLRAVGALTGTTSLTGAQVQASLGLMEPPYARFFGDHPVAAMLLQPLRVAGRPLGLLGVSRERGVYDAADVELVAHVGYVLSVVLQSLRVQEQQRTALRLAQEHQAAQARLAATDELTGLLNRRGFAQRLPAPGALSAAAGVLVLDLDDFKAVNDSFGHAAGDALLLGVGAVLEASLPPGTALARTGGDEFTVLLRGASGDDVRGLLRVLTEAAPQGQRVLGVEVPLHLSAGLDVTEAGELFDPTRAVQQADVAMYRAKRAARTDSSIRLVEFEARVDSAALRRLPDAARLRRGIDRGELVLHYQRSVPTGAVRQEGPALEHLEALVRWERDGELLPPAAFLPLAAEVGALGELTEAVLDLAVEQVVRWRAAGHAVSVAVNVPPHLLVRPALLDGVLARLARHGLPPAALGLEVTESELVQAGGREAVGRAIAAGLTVAVDDFGTGFSALAYLVDVPFSELKLDRALVQGLDTHPVRRMVVRHCARFCHDLGLTVVAEGVERQEEQDVLTRLGVDRLQGYHLHRPCPASDLFRPGGG